MIGIIEQNWSQDGERTLPITNWRVGGSIAATNWLHSSSSGFCDDFSAPVLNSGWHWVDPLGDSSYSLTANPGHLRLFTPDNNHDLYPYANLNAPRVLQYINGDFVVTTKVTINPQYNYQGAGLLIWQNVNNFVRLERTLVDGVDMWFNIGGNHAGIQIPYFNQSVYLRFQRSGSSITASYSTSGLSWTTVSTVDFPSVSTLQVGLSLTNQWQNNPIWADFDYFGLGSCTFP
jgi:regulation of enolase protein 1 (concanavalin A-like superfamily)